MLGCFRHLRLSATPWTAACQAPLSVGFSGQEYWSGVPFPSPLVAVHSHLIAVAFLLQSSRVHGLQEFYFPGSRAQASCGTQPGCSEACGIFLYLGSNPLPLQWLLDSPPLSHQGSPIFIHLFFFEEPLYCLPQWLQQLTF